MRHRGIEDILVKRLEQKYVDAKIPDILLRAAERAMNNVVFVILEMMLVMKRRVSIVLWCLRSVVF